MGSRTTVLRTAGRALVDGEDRSRLLVEGTKDYAIFMLDVGGHIASGNAGARRIKGSTEDEVLGCHCSIFDTARDLRSGKPQWEVRADAGRRDTPLLAVSALSPVGDRERALRAGFDGDLTKPIDPEMFVARLEPFLTTKAGPREKG